MSHMRGTTTKEIINSTNNEAKTSKEIGSGNNKRKLVEEFGLMINTQSENIARFLSVVTGKTNANGKKETGIPVEMLTKQDNIINELVDFEETLQKTNLTDSKTKEAKKQEGTALGHKYVELHNNIIQLFQLELPLRENVVGDYNRLLHALSPNTLEKDTVELKEELLRQIDKINVIKESIDFKLKEMETASGLVFNHPLFVDHKKCTIL